MEEVMHHLRKIVAATIVALSLFGSAGVASAGTRDNSEVCSDWTNEDGTHGTNCPSGGTGGRKLIWDYIRSNG
jgi:hypothetical protein